MKLARWMWSLLLVCVPGTPLFALTDDDTAKAKAPSATALGTDDTTKAKAPAPAPDAKDGDSSTNKNSSSSPAPVANAKVAALLDVLVKKGILAPTEASQIRNASPDTELQLLVEALNRKGILSAADLTAVADSAPAPSTPAASPAPVASGPTFVASSTSPDTNPVSVSTGAQQGQAPRNPQPQTQAAGTEPQSSRPTPRGVVPAVVPIRALPIDPPTKDGLVAAFKTGGVKMTPYGFIKASAAHDSSSPNGDDFPFVGLFLSSTSILNTGPTKDPEFHLKARSTRFGANFEWPDPSPKLVVTGRVEGDFEGNFSEVDNRDVTSIRSNMPQLRLAFVRLDYHANDRTDIFFVGGQDWTLFGSGALMNIVETTFNGAFWGNPYGRSPQLRGGFIETLDPVHKVNLEGQVGIMMPSSGQILKLGSLGRAGQLGQGEREGADSDRPEWEGRVALSYQVDPAPGVAPAQIALAGFRGSRTSIAYNLSAAGSSVPYGTLCATTNYCSTFPNGFQASSTMWGGQIVAQLPTRWFTLVASAYKGGDLRFLLGGQLNTFATDVSGLTGVQGPFPTLDGGPLAAAGGAVLGCSGTFTSTGPAVNGITPGSCAGTVVVAPQRPIRA